MNTLPQSRLNHVRILRAAVGLAFVTSLAYILMAFNVLGVGDLQVGEKPINVIFVAAACYLLGGGLILLRNRWLLLFGAFINAMVVLFFFNLYQDRPAVMFSPGGLISKTAQILLEFALLYTLAVNWRKATVKSRESSTS
jgi:hypothetical protein